MFKIMFVQYMGLKSIEADRAEEQRRRRRVVRPAAQARPKHRLWQWR
jgi:hypothetical protein